MQSVNKINSSYETLTSCPYCHSNNIKTILETKDYFSKKEGNFFLSRCPDCHLFFQNPRVKPGLIAKYYQDSELGYYIPSNNSFHLTSIDRATLINHFGYSHLGRQSSWMKLITTMFFNRREKIRLTPKYVQNGTLLEIGCSHGERLHYLKELGWEVTGVELDETSSRYAREKRGLSVINQKIENINFEEKKFDAVILSMVLEHLPDPIESLNRVCGWIKPGGQLIISIPYPGMEYHIFRKYFHDLHLPHHYFFFKKTHTSQILKDLNFDNIQYYFQYTDRNLFGSLANLLSEQQWHYPILLIQRILSLKLIRRVLIKPLLYLFSIFGWTSRVSIHSFKKGVA